MWICQLLSRNFSTFNGLDIGKTGLQLLEFSLHQKAEASIARSIPSKLYDRLLPVGLVEPA